MQQFSSSSNLPRVTHDVEHHLVTRGPPIASKFRRLDGEKLAAAKAEFEKMESDDIVPRSTSPWASPLHMVEKADGSWRPCGDFRRLNLVTTANSYPLPNMMDFSTKAEGCTVFSKIDLRKGYYQIPMHAADIEKTAITTPFGLFEFTRMPLGLRNAGCTFQRLMDRALAGLEHSFWYLDNIIVASRDVLAHSEHLKQLFDRLEKYGLMINSDKCVFAVPTVDFLGHTVSVNGVKPMSSNTAALLQHPLPSNIKQLQAFLGLVNFYRRFIPAAARLLRLLTDAFRGSKQGTSPVEWTLDCLAAVDAAKQAVAAATDLAHPVQGAELALFVDASAEHVGAVLQQKIAASTAWQPLGFFLKKLEPAQVKYSAFDRELWACVAGIRHFRHMLEGRPFTIYTDHKPLTQALHQSSEPWTARQCRHLSYVAEFTSDVRHVAGVDNVVADTLSRPPPCQPGQDAAATLPPGSTLAVVDATTSKLDYAAIAAHQQDCPKVAAMARLSSLRIRPVIVEDVELLCDVSTGALRPLIPTADREAVFLAFHGLAHAGTRATRQLISARVVWRHMAADITRWCSDCQQCQRGKVTVQAKTAVQPIPIPPQRFHHSHCWPAPRIRGGLHVLTDHD
jgi:RNase H-like domain found in reverse transcriptase/Reverse transcriptase (RNA-dependent DNA polymerase)/Integrase zinc binding domain